MAYNNQLPVGERFCEATKLGLAIVGGINNQAFKTAPKPGVVQALLDENNVIPQYQAAVNGSTTEHYIKIPYLPRATESEVISAHNCESGDTVAYKELGVDINDFYLSQISFKVTESELVQYCEDVNRITTAAGSEAAEVLFGFSSVINGDPSFRHFNDVFNKLASRMNALRAEINRNITAKLISSLGVNIATGLNTPFSIPLLNLADFSKREEALHILSSHAVLNQVNGGYTLVGFGKLNSFITSLNYGCCNANGLDWDAVANNTNLRYYQDIYVGQESGDDDFFLMLPLGETQFVWRNRNLVNAKTNTRGVTRGTISDPMLPGVTYDVEIREFDCINDDPGEVYEVFLRARYDVIITPEFAYNTTDPMFGYNGILGYIGTAV